MKTKQRRGSGILTAFAVMTALSLVLFAGCPEPEPPPLDVGSEDNPIALTDGSFYNGSLDVVGRKVWFSFPVVQGTTYYVYQEDYYNATADLTGYKADIGVSIKYSDAPNYITSDWEPSPHGSSSPYIFTANRNGTVLLLVQEAFISFARTGTFRIKYAAFVPQQPIQKVTISGINNAHNDKIAWLLLDDNNGATKFYGYGTIENGSITLILSKWEDDTIATGGTANGTYTGTLIIYEDNAAVLGGNYTWAGIVSSVAISGESKEQAFSGITDSSLGAVTIRVNNTIQTAQKVGVELTAVLDPVPSGATVSWQWNLNGEAITTGDGYTNKYIPRGPGQYSVTAHVSGYVSKTSAIVTVTDADVVPGQQKVAVDGIPPAHNGKIAAILLFPVTNGVTAQTPSFYGYGTVANGAAAINLLVYGNQAAPQPTGTDANGVYEADLLIANDMNSMINQQDLVWEGYTTTNITIDGEEFEITYTSFTAYDRVHSAVMPGSIAITPSGNVALGPMLTATYTPLGGPATVSYQWYKDNSMITSGGNTATYTPTLAGQYYVTISATGYSNKNSNTVNITAALAYAYQITSPSAGAFTAVRDSGPTVGTGTIQAVIDAIRTDANGQAVDITFGTSSSVPLNIGDGRVVFGGTGWGAVKLYGYITGTNVAASPNGGIVAISDAVNVESEADIANTAVDNSAVAVYNNSSGTVTISGGNISSGGSAIVTANANSKLVVGGTTTLISSTNTNTSYGAIVLGGASTTLTMAGGIVQNMANSEDARALRVTSTGGTVNINGGTVKAGIGRAILANVASTGADVKINIEGGTVTSANTNINGGTVNMAGGITLTIDGAAQVTNTAANADGRAIVVSGITAPATGLDIRGGTVSAIQGRAINIASNTSKVAISGGTVTSAVANNGTINAVNSDSVTLTITGGTVSNTSTGEDAVAISGGNMLITGGTITAAGPRAIYLTSNITGGVSLAGNPTIIGSIYRDYLSVDRVIVLGSPPFNPINPIQLEYSETIASLPDGTVAVVGGGSYVAKFAPVGTKLDGRDLIAGGTSNANIVITTPAQGHQRNPIVLTGMPQAPGAGVWHEDEFLTNGEIVWFSFSVVSGKTYNILWDDAWDASGTESAEIAVSAMYKDESTWIFENEDSGFSTPQNFTADRTGTVLIRVIEHPESVGDPKGTYALAVVEVGTGGVGAARPSIVVKPR